MKKKNIILLAVLALILLMIPTAFAAETSGNCGASILVDGQYVKEPVYWNYDAASKTLTISGDGAMRDDAGGAGFYGIFGSFNDEVETVIIEEGITHIGQGAFYMPNLTEVQIPDSVVSIGPSAFGYGENESQWLKDLKASPDENGNVIVNDILLYSGASGSIVIPNGIRSIAGGAIGNATYVTLPQSVEYVSYAAINYWDNKDLVSVTVLNPECVFFKCNGWQKDKPSAIGVGLSWNASGPDSIYTISGLTIRGCANSTAQAYCDEVNSFTSDNGGKPWTFSEIPLSGTCGENLAWTLADDGTLVITGSGPMTNWEWYTEVPWSEVGGSFINKVEICDSVTSIGDYAFQNCWLEGEISIPESVEAIGEGAFAGCTMSDILIWGDPEIAEHAIGYVVQLGQSDPGVWVKVFSPMAENDLTIHGYKNSTAEAYAAVNRINYVEIELPSDDPIDPDPPVSEETDPPASEETDPPVSEETDPPASEETDPPNESGEPSTPAFTDVVPGSFYEDAVSWAVDNGITNGKTKTAFAPEDFCKRSEVVTFLHRAEGKPAAVQTDTPFTDVEAGRFYSDAVAWAVENQITNGMGDGTFGVDLSCTRAQVVTFLWRTAGSPTPSSSECPFTDVAPGSFYYDAVAWAVENGITNGMGDGTFGVNGTCTRAQIVTFLYRFAG